MRIDKTIIERLDLRGWGKAAKFCPEGIFFFFFFKILVIRLRERAQAGGKRQMGRHTVAEQGAPGWTQSQDPGIRA